MADQRYVQFKPLGLPPVKLHGEKDIVILATRRDVKHVDEGTDVLTLRGR